MVSGVVPGVTSVPVSTATAEMLIPVPADPRHLLKWWRAGVHEALGRPVESVLILVASVTLCGSVHFVLSQTTGFSPTSQLLMTAALSPLLCFPALSAPLWVGRRRARASHQPSEFPIASALAVLSSIPPRRALELAGLTLVGGMTCAIQPPPTDWSSAFLSGAHLYTTTGLYVAATIYPPTILRFTNPFIALYESTHYDQVRTTRLMAYAKNTWTDRTRWIVVVITLTFALLWIGRSVCPPVVTFALAALPLIYHQFAHQVFLAVFEHQGTTDRARTRPLATHGA